VIVEDKPEDDKVITEVEETVISDGDEVLDTDEMEKSSKEEV